MTSEKGWYWVAAGVLAIGLSNGFSSRPADWVQRAKDHALLAAQQVSIQLVSHVEQATGLVCRRQSVEAPSPDVLTAQIDAQLARAQAQMARERAAMARVQAEQVRIAVADSAQQVVVACPRESIRVQIPTVLAHLPERVAVRIPSRDDGSI